MNDVEDIASGSFHSDRGSRSLLILGVCSLLVAIIISVGAVVYTQNQIRWNPLGDYSTQTVNPKIISISETVNTTGRKCSKENGITVRFEGVTWRAVTAGIVISEVNSGEGRRYRSCGPTPEQHEFTFTNLVPKAIQDIVKAQGPSLWYLTSVETPIRGNGEEGVPRVWVTEPFRLVL